MFKAIVKAILCLALPGAALAAGGPLTLGEAMLLALQHNPGLKATGMSVETAEADVAKARARFLPTVNFGETYNFSDNPTQVFMNKLNQRVFTQQDFLLNNLNFPSPRGISGPASPWPSPYSRLARLCWAASRRSWAGKRPAPWC